MAKPLLKWAGGKRQLLKELESRIPSSFDTYWEPFMGGAALFFKVAGYDGDRSYHLSDINSTLCVFYQVVRDCPMKLVEYIGGMEFRNTSVDYYEARTLFNNMTATENPVEKSGLFLYLNRHCFNGLYRENSRGEFNVPFGSYISPRMPIREQILEASESLSGVIITNSDFQEILSGVDTDDFVYFDPPYEPMSKSSSFTAYNRGGFGRWEQERLSRILKELDRRNVKFMLSNSGSEELGDLYNGFNVSEVNARRNINSVASGRGKIREILVTNY